jgi:hypothetical protein
MSVSGLQLDFPDVSRFQKRLQEHRERAERIAWLMKPQTIERHKAAMRTELLGRKQ